MGILDAPAPLSASPSREGYTRATTGRVMFIDDASNGIEGRFNDGIGSAFVDWDAQIAGYPSIRLDNQGLLSSSAANYGSCVGKCTTSVTLTPTSSVSLIFSLLNTANSPAAQNLSITGGPFQFMATDGNTYIGTYTDFGYTSPNVTLNGCKLMTVASTTANVVPGTSVFGQPGASATCPVWGSQSLGLGAAYLGYVVAGNPWTNCGLSANTQGVVFKRRIMDNEISKFGAEYPMRYTNTRAAGSSVSGTQAGINQFAWSLSIYNRDGGLFHAARMMLQPNVTMLNGSAVNGQSSDNAILWVVTGGATNAPVMQPLAIITKTSFNQHGWDPYSALSWDRAGGWHTAKIVADFGNQLITSVQFDDMYFPLQITMPSISVKGSAKMVHFQTEFCQSKITGATDNRGWVNVGPLTGTLE